jgi:DNA-binding LytR/AlgR family response regulator
MSSDYLFIPCGSQYEKININSLIYIKSEAAQTQVVTTAGVFTSDTDLTQIQKYLPSHLFCRVHDAYLVALNKIVYFDRRSIQLSGVYIPLGKKYFARLKQKIKIIETVAEPKHFSSLIIGPDGKLNGSGI